MERRNSYEGFFIVSTVGCNSQRAQETVERCCSCTRHSTCSTMGPSVRGYKCRNPLLEVHMVLLLGEV